MSFLLFDHIGGLNTLFHTLSNGGTVICPNARTPQDICALIEKHRVEILPTSPSFLNLLLMTQAYQNYDLSSLKVVTYGTEVMPEYTLKQLHSTMPNVQLKQTYGLSELGILRTKSKDSGSLLVHIGGEGYQTKVVNDILFIKSETAMEGYLNAPQPFDEKGWVNTQDHVVVEGDYLRILGRRSEIINVGGRKVYPAEVEDVLIQMSEITDATVKGESNPILGSIVSAVVNVNEQLEIKELKQRIRAFCADKLEPFQVPVKVHIQEEALYSERYKKIRS
ncbi:putative acyl--CoA ligase YhfT [compost metagenome]